MRPGLWQILLILLVVILLFGAKRIPDLARSIGKARSEFRKGQKEGDPQEPSADQNGDDRN